MERERVFAVFGLGRFGFEICKVLSVRGAKVIAVDKDEKLISKIKDTVTQAVLMDSTDGEALRNAGLQDVDMAIIAIGDNIDASILTTILLKNMGVPYIIARAISDVHAQVLKQIGATEVLNLEVDQGRRLAQRVIAPDIMDVIPVSDSQSITELRIPKGFIGKSLRQLEVRKRYNVNIISVKRADTVVDDMGNPQRKESVFSPKPDETLNANDVLVVLGAEKDINRLREI